MNPTDERRQAEQAFEDGQLARKRIENWAWAGFRRLLMAAEKDPASAVAALVCMLLDDDKYPCGIKRAEELPLALHADLMDVLRWRDLISPALEDLIEPDLMGRTIALSDVVWKKL
jgi:hypothetical protein